ncbi:MAG: NAD(P)/FAD-dependent oxidoreductase [Pseudomonadota bacterium]
MASDSAGTKPRVAIVGGGNLGAELAKGLEQDLDVTLIERATAFTHAPAMIRSVVDPSLLERALIPYDRLLKNGRVLTDEAVGVDGKGVSLKSGGRVEADYVVLATGSGNVAPFKSASGDIDALRTANADWHAAISAAGKIVIIGAGAVGTELAGEIASAMPGKKVTLVSSDASLFPTLPAKLGRGLFRKLEAMGVDIVFGARASTLPEGDAPTGGTVELSTGQSLEADLIVPAVGSLPHAGLADELPGASRGPDGRIKTDAWMRPSELPNVFAAGDVADNGDLMTIVAVSRQVPWLTKTLKSLAAGKSIELLTSYKPWGKAPILLPLGPKRGNSFMVILTAGDWITSMMKGRDLFLTKYQKTFGRSG